ncbi:7958_t:CDS:2, partial [Dentiscutata heterogama]
KGSTGSRVKETSAIDLGPENGKPYLMYLSSSEEVNNHEPVLVKVDMAAFTDAYDEVKRLSNINNDKKLAKNEVASLFTYFNNSVKLPCVEKALNKSEDDDIKLTYLRIYLGDILTYQFSQMNDRSTSELTKVIEKISDRNSALFTEFLQVVNRNSALIDRNPELFSELSQVVKKNSASIDKNSELIDKNLEVLDRNLEIMEQSLLVLIRLDRNSRPIGRNNETATVTRAKAYQSTSFVKVDEDYFLNMNNSYLEDDIQDWFNKLMTNLPKFAKKLVVKDTHTNAYLDGLKPDLSVFMEEDVENDVYLTMSVLTLLEVKRRKGTSVLLNEDKGQVLNYIRVLIDQQPLREHFVVFLSDGFYFYVMAYDRKVNQYFEFTTNFKTGLQLFWVLLNFSSPLTNVQGPRSVMFLYEIDWNNTPSVIKVFKSGYSSETEVSALKFLNENYFENVPQYVAHDDSSPDVRPENILLNSNYDTLILADWGSSIRHTHGGMVNYEGTITFASPNVLKNNFNRYVPKASDDLHSFVRTVYILRNPSKFPTTSDENFELKAKVIREFWNDMLDAKLKGPFWTENEDYEALRKCCYVFKK